MQESGVGFERRPIATSQPSLFSAFHRIKRLFALHGATGLVRLFLAKTVGFILWFTPSRRRARAAAQERDLEFDRKWGVETSGSFVPDESGVVGRSWIYGCRYQGVDAEALEQALIEIGIDHKEFTFIDFGSGKGRAVLIASRFPFRRVIGVEYSEQLNNFAKRNVELFRKNQNVCDQIDLLWADALDAPIPEGPLVVFLYNPFGQAIMSDLVQRIATSFQRSPRRIVVLYFHAAFPDVWRQAGFLREVRCSMSVSIYDSLTPNS